MHPRSWLLCLPVALSLIVMDRRGVVGASAFELSAVPRIDMSCNYGPWSAPRAGGGDGAPLAYWPRMTARAAGPVYVAGMAMRVPVDDSPLPSNPLIVQELGGASLGRPTGAFRFSHPLPLVDGRDRLHIVWGEPPGGAGPVTFQEWFFQEKVGALWTAMYEHGRGWSVPRKLFEDSTQYIRWDERVHSSVAGGRWMLAVPADARESGPGAVVTIGFADDTLTAEMVRWPYGGLVYSSVAAVGNKVFLGIVTGWAPPTPAPTAGAPSRITTDVNSVLLLASSDGGNTWRPPMLVSRSGQFPAYAVTVFASPDGRVHLLWLQELGNARRVLRHVVSTDDGSSWSAPEDLVAPPGEPESPVAVVDACGTLHVIFQLRDHATQRAQLAYAAWRDHWTPVERLLDALVTTGAPSLSLAPDGRLLLAFLARPADASAQTPFAPVVAERSIR